MEDNKDLSTIQENSESKENSIQITETLTAEDLKKVNILLLSTKRNIITLIVGIIAIVYGAINLLVNKDKSSMAYDSYNTWCFGHFVLCVFRKKTSN